MTPVLLSTLLASNERDKVNHRKTIKEALIDAAFSEIGESAAANNIPTKQLLQSTSPTLTLSWDAVASFCKSNNQSNESYKEQQLAIQTTIDSIDSYRQFQTQSSYTKNMGVRGSPGGGKTWCMMYYMLYAISKGLIVTTTALQCSRALHLGGIHIHQLFLVPTEDNIPSLYRRAELAVLRLLKNPTKLDFICTLQILFVDEMGQMDDGMLAILDIIFRKLKKSNIYMGGVLLIFTMDHLQIKPING